MCRICHKYPVSPSAFNLAVLPLARISMVGSSPPRSIMQCVTRNVHDWKSAWAKLDFCYTVEWWYVSRFSCSEKEKWMLQFEEMCGATFLGPSYHPKSAKEQLFCCSKYLAAILAFLVASCLRKRLQKKSETAFHIPSWLSFPSAWKAVWVMHFKQCCFATCWQYMTDPRPNSDLDVFPANCYWRRKGTSRKHLKASTNPSDLLHMTQLSNIPQYQNIELVCLFIYFDHIMLPFMHDKAESLSVWKGHQKGLVS